ncbi:hypothetical protein P3S68_005255 [Capsicum galapagoense]
MENSMFVEREELMVSPSGGIPHLRKAHFLNPIASSIEGPNVKPPSLFFSSASEWPLRVSFNGCRHQQIKWKKWVEAMESVHHSVWKAAGVYDAIKGSVYKVHIDKNLIFGLAERWCCDTNTFVFPWGEATVTLEDIMILGGFSVLGGPVWFALQSPELVEIEQNLEKARMELIGLKADNHNRFFGGKNDKKSLSMVGSQTLACDVVPPSLREKHNAGKGVHTSTEAHDSSSVVPPSCIVEYGTENLSKEVCQSAARDVAPPGSTEKHADCEHDRTENNSTAHNLLVGEQGGGERTICNDVIEDIELYLRELERSAASRRRC